MSLIRTHWKYIPVMSLAVLLSGCLSSDDAPTAATISGTAATGAPIIGGAVTVDCASGNNLTTTTSNTGAWSVTISGQTAPCAVQVVTTGGDSYFSFAPAIGSVANVTPLTSLIVANLSGEDPATWFGGLNPARFAAFDTTAEIDAAVTAVTAALGLNTALGSNNPVRTAFSATNGNIIDDVLEAFQTALAGAGVDFDTLLADVRNATITPPTGFNSAFTIAFGTLPSGGGGSGGGATSCSAGQTLLTYDGTNVTPMTDGNGYCATVSTTSLTINGVTMTDPVGTPFGKFYDSTNDLFYEVVFINNALHEINVIFDRDGDGVYDQQQSINDTSADIFKGQLTVASQGGGGDSGGSTGGQTGTLTVGVSISGGPATTFGVAMPGMAIPASQSEFCTAIDNDSTFTSIGASGGGSLTINSCSYSGNVGTINATLSITSPVALTLPYAVTYTYQ